MLIEMLGQGGAGAAEIEPEACPRRRRQAKLIEKTRDRVLDSR